MAPKPVPGKKGQVDQEDFSDVPTLPPLNSYIFALLFNNFFSPESREKVQKYTMEHLPAERVKTLNRDEIIAYAKVKQIILEPNVAATLPQDDPRLKMSEADQLAKATVDKLFELSVHARRAKKEKIQKSEEESKLQQQTDPKFQLQMDPDQLDVMFQLVDFPNTKAEALAFAKYSHSLQCVFNVNQALKVAENEEEADQLWNQEKPAYDERSMINQKTEDKLGALLDARASSVKISSLRQLAVVPLEFQNVPLVDFKVNEQGEEVEDRQESEVAFSNLLNSRLEHYGALFVKYLKFKEKVTLMPLAPDKFVAEALREMHIQQEDYKQWLQEVDQADTLNQSQKDLMDPASLEDYNRNKELYKKEVEEMKVAKAQEDEQRKAQVNELKAKLKDSVDDQYYIKDFKLNAYKDSFLPYKESQNSIASIMSAMVSQIAVENSYQEVYEQHQQSTVSTEPETINDLFDSMYTDYIDAFGSQQKPYDLNASQEYAGGVNQTQRNGIFGYNRQVTDAFASQQTIVGEIDYDEEQDLIKQSIHKLPKGFKYDEARTVENICRREYEVMENLQLPGFNRHMMPPVPSKSKRIREAERPAVYPFSTLPIEDTERGLIMKSFQDLLRANQIDEGLTGEQKPYKYKAFDRNYESHMTSNILKQTIAEAMLTDPDIATLYYPRDDSLLLTLYNKVKLADRTENDGERKWRAAYRVMPDFENWLKYFADEVVVPPQQANAGKPESLKYQLDEEMIPETLLDIDDQKIQSVEEHSQMFYPKDGSIIKVDKFTVGGQTYKKSMVIKDNIKFGLRKKKQHDQSALPEEEKEYGLATFQPAGKSEMWINFENDTKMLVELVKLEKNPQRLIRIDPPKPTPEEIAAREEAIKASQIAAAKQKPKAGSALANQPPVIEEYKEPEPTWEPEPRDELDYLLDNLLTGNTQPLTTTTFVNGLIVQHTAEGNILQMNEEQLYNKDLEEKDRVYLFSAPGVVVRHMKNRDAEVLFPNGNRAQFIKKDMMWIITNNKGIRQAKKDGIQWDLDPISCAYETDAVTNAKMMIREDKVMTIRFADGSFFCQHVDGTIMRRNANKTEIRIEKDGYAPVIRKNDPSAAKIYDSNCDKMQALARSSDGQLFETHLPDGTIAESYREYNYRSYGVSHVFRRPDFSIVTVSPGGEVRILTANTRSELNEDFSKRVMGEDWKYYDLLFNDPPYDKMTGNYIGSVSLTLDGSDGASLEAYDCFSDIKYVVTTDTLVKLTQSGYKITYEPTAPGIKSLSDNIEIEDIGGFKHAQQKHFIYPRMFVIKSDGSGYEMLAQEQLEYYFRNAKVVRQPSLIFQRKESYKQSNVVLIGNSSAKAHYIVTKVKTLQERQQELLQLKSLPFPQNAQYALLHSKAAPKANANGYNLPEQYLFRQIFEFAEFEPFKQEAFYDDLDRFKKWRISQVRYDTEFGIVHVPAKDQQLDFKRIEDEEFVAKRIINKIMKERRTKRKTFNPIEFKNNFVDSLGSNQDIHEYQKRVTMNMDRFGDESVLGKQDETALDQRFGSANGNTNSLLEAKNQDQIRNIKKKQEAYIQNQLSDIRRMINTPTFVPTYFQSKEGQQFTKNNPEKPPSQEMLLRMSQRINRSQQNTEKGAASHDNSPMHKTDNNAEGIAEEKESPIVALEPEDQFKQGSAFLGTKNQTQGGPQASLYLQEKMYYKQREQETLLKAEEYHVVKTKDFNVVGRLRQEKPYVKAIQKSSAQSELNEKFITTECIADRRVKISSMAPRQYINAPSIEDVRKQGQHQMILSAINKKQTFSELINTANAMVTSVLHDPLKRSFNIMPGAVRFGTLQVGQVYELILTMKNEDQVAQRVTVKPLADRRILVQQLETGPVAPGMIKKISVSVQADEECTIKETLQIVSKTDIFKIPIEANILSAENYQKELQEQQALHGKSLHNSRVRNKLNQSIQKGRMSAKGERKMSIEGEEDYMSAGGGQQQRAQWIETTNSESKLPQIPQIDKRPFEVDPKKPLKELLKKGQ